MTDPAALGCGLLVAAALLVLGGRSAPPPSGRLGRLLRAPAGHRPRSAAPAARAPQRLPGTAEIAVLAEQIAGLARAGLPPARVWRALADRATDPAVRSMAAAVLAAQHRGRPAGGALLAFLGAVPAARPGGVKGAASPPARGSGRRAPARLWSGRQSSRRRWSGRWTSREEGVGALVQLIVALDVSERTGAALSVTLLRLAEALRQQQAAAGERASALAGPRASAVLLSLLPLAGLGLGALLGGDPLHVLLFTVPGRGCLLVGGGLWLAGRTWTALLVRRAAAVS